MKNVILFFVLCYSPLVMGQQDISISSRPDGGYTLVVENVEGKDPLWKVLNLAAKEIKAKSTTTLTILNTKYIVTYQEATKMYEVYTADGDVVAHPTPTVAAIRAALSSHVYQLVTGREYTNN